MNNKPVFDGKKKIEFAPMKVKPYTQMNAKKTKMEF